MQIRLFDKRYANWDMLDVGERLSYPAGIMPAAIDGEMHHYRCNRYTEYEAKEMRHAAMRARLMAAAGISAAEPMCWLRAASAFVRCHLSQGAWLDGEAGRRIAATRFRSTLAAYRAARRIIDEEK